jgi:hypothetical protein
MKTTSIRYLSLIVGTVGLLAANSVLAQGTAFTYQGRLTQNGMPASGSYDFHFSLFTNLSGGTSLAGPLTNTAVSLSNGLFVTTLDFGPGIFDGSSYWLEIAVSTNGAGAFVTLAPRQELTPAPYAVFAEAANATGLAGTLPAGSISGTYGNPVNFSNGQDTFYGTFRGDVFGAAIVGGEISGDGSGIGGVWHTVGDFGTNPNLEFIGTRDYTAFQVRVNDTIALEYSPAPSLPNVVAGLSAFRPTIIGANVSGAVVAGGGAPSNPVAGNGVGDFFAVYDNDGTIGGGFGNKVGSPDSDVTDGAFATVGGGVFNSAANYAAVVAGGDANAATGSHAAILGGYDNQALDAFTVIGGGEYNTVQTNSPWSFIGGGQFNTNGGSWSTVAGGASNYAGANLSFAAGNRAKAINAGTFVWADSTPADFNSTTSNQFAVRANGGVVFVTGGVGVSVDGLPILSSGPGDVVSPNEFAFVGGGENNSVQSDATNSSILAGANNTILSGAVASTIGGGANNNNGAYDSTIAGGAGNTIQGPSHDSVIGGGYLNNIQPGSATSTVAGGAGNNIGSNSGASTIGGGLNSSIGANSLNCTVAGGLANQIGSSAQDATISGGQGNAIQTGAHDAIIGGGYFNNIGPAASGSTIGGGEINIVQSNAFASFIGGGVSNAIQTNAYESVIAGGTNNLILASASGCVIGGGGNNAVLAGGASTIGGGFNNTNGAYDCTMAGGNGNTIQAGAHDSTIGGGYLNTVQQSADTATIAGGAGNNIGTFSGSSTIAGGLNNAIQADGANATIGGGSGNVIQGLSSGCVIPGGLNNVATGNWSFAAGNGAQAINSASLVWGDGSITTASTTNNSVTFRATGGYRFLTGTGTFGAALAPLATSWSVLSDRNAKKDFARVDSQAILEKLAQVPVQSWRYNWEESSGTPHLGPTAQDFKAAFYPGRDYTSITTLEFDGVELAAIQGLNQKLEQKLKDKDAQIAHLEESVAELKNLVAQLAQSRVR